MGFANLLRGIFGTFRNPPTHAARAAAEWTITEADSLGGAQRLPGTAGVRHSPTVLPQRGAVNLTLSVPCCAAAFCIREGGQKGRGCR